MNYIGNFDNKLTKAYPVGLDKVRVKGYLGDIIDKNIESIKKGFGSTIAELFVFLDNGTPFTPFHDRLAAESDVFKLMEGACYAYAYSKDEELKDLINLHTSLILKRQEEDGFILHTNKTRFDEKYFHDLYILGHFIEFAVAHYETFGDRIIVEACKKWIDTMIEEYEKGNPYYDKVKQCEHSEIELGLVRFYRITGEKKYLDFAITIAKMFDVTQKLGDCIIGAGDRHVVRVHYLLMGMLEAYLETGKDELFANTEQLVNEILDTRMYITGGVGSNEWYPKAPYILPQTGDIAETCGSTSLSMLLWRLFQISPKAKYLNALELIFHNHLLASLSKDQDAIFYYNPIKSKENIIEPHKRIKLPTVHACSCCFPNIWRFFAQLPEYIFSVSEDCIYINYYASAEADIDINGKTVHIETETDFPKSGRMTVRVSEPVKMKIKKPYYAESADFRVTGTYEEEGYFVFENPGYIGFGFDYRIKLIETSEKVKENTKQAAITRGPIVYVLERDQKEGSINSLILMTDRDIEFKDGKIYAWFTERKPKDRLYFEYTRPICLELIPFNEIANKDCVTEWSVFLNIQ